MVNHSTGLIRRPWRAWPPTARIAAAVIATTSLALPVAASGSGQPMSNTQTALAYSHCMRSHGVLNFPDPNSSGSIPKISPQQLGVSSSVFDVAQNHCRYLLPNGGSGPSQTQVQQIMNGMLKFAQCMRSHGVSEWPDPVVDAGGNPEFYLGGRINQNSPQIQSTIHQCLHWIPSEAISPGNPIACPGTNPGGGPGCGGCSCTRRA
jgi:hypothetical protein